MFEEHAAGLVVDKHRLGSVLVEGEPEGKSTAAAFNFSTKYLEIIRTLGTLVVVRNYFCSATFAEFATDIHGPQTNSNKNFSSTRVTQNLVIDTLPQNLLHWSS